MTIPTQHDDLIHSRDVIDTLSGTTDVDDLAELKILQTLAAEGEDSAPDWIHGEVMIRDSYFERCAMELSDDIGAVPSDATWPITCIDWPKAARELQMDYTSLEFDGVIYWIR